ncbi:MAG TPA: tetratricopeptide repeat protein [Methylomirabilota bacterium]|nr:tetratricopeptide repeat protein [Methylomirabilota bacterium]
MARYRPAAVVALIVGLALGSLQIVRADPTSPAVEERRQSPFAPDAESEYNRGVRARVAGNWAAAVDALRAAVVRRPAFPDGWNELGYALRHLGRYQESLDAYGEALRLRPDFPEALEYLGEAYVQMGRLDDARRVLERLRPLDAARARELAEEISKGAGASR